MPAVSIYLSDEAVKRLDGMVSNQALVDRAAGLTGRKVASRSSIVQSLIMSHVDAEKLTLERITYHVVDLAKKYGASRVSLFGSYARGEADDSSDVDLLLEKGRIKGMQVLDFQEELSHNLGCKVDVVTTAGVSERFLKRIQPDCIEIYSSNSAVRA